MGKKWYKKNGFIFVNDDSILNAVKRLERRGSVEVDGDIGKHIANMFSDVNKGKKIPLIFVGRNDLVGLTGIHISSPYVKIKVIKNKVDIKLPPTIF